MAAPGVILTLKIYIETTAQVKAFRFPGDAAVADIIKEIREKSQQGGKDFGLFSPPNPTTKTVGFWLARNRALRFYQLKNDARLEYKKKHRPLAIKTADGAEKKILIDDSATVRAISDAIGLKLGLGKHAEMFCLAASGGTPKHPSWLREDKTLHDLPGVDPASQFEYLKRYAVGDYEVAAHDAHILHLLYVTAVDQIIHEVYPITRVDARDFAALQLQVTYGDYNPETHKIGFADLTKFVPASFLRVKDKDDHKKFVQEIYRDHKKLKGCKDNVAKTRYLQLARSLKTYGITFFDCLQEKEEILEKTKKKGKITRELTGKGAEKTIYQSKKTTKKVTFGVSLTKFYIYDPDTNKFTDEWAFNVMKSWDVVQNTCTLEFGNADVPDFSLKFICEQAEGIVHTIAGYIAIILRMKKDRAAEITDSSGSIGEIDEGDIEWGQTDLQIMSSYQNPARNPNLQGTFMMGGMGNPKNANPSSPHPSVHNVNNLPSALLAMKAIGNELGSGKGNWGRGALTEENWQKQFDASKAQLQTGINDLLGTLSMSGPLDRRALDTKATALHLTMLNVTTAARNLAALNDDNAPLLDGAKALCDSLADLMGLVMNHEMGEGGPSLQEILAASKKQFAAANFLINNPRLAGYVDEGAKVLLMQCIADVDAKIEAVIEVISNEKVTPEQHKILMTEAKKAQAIKGVALSTMANMAPHLGNDQALAHIHLAGDTVTDLLGALEGKYKSTVPNHLAHGPVLSGIEDVHTALKCLFEASKTTEARGIPGDLDIITPSTDVLNSLAQLRAAVNSRDPYQLAGPVDALSRLTPILETALRGLAPQIPKLSHALEINADQLRDNAHQLTLVAAHLQNDPNSLENVPKAIALINTMETCVQTLISEVGETTALNNMRFRAKDVAARLVRLGINTGAAAPHLPNAERDLLLKTSKDFASTLSELLALLQLASNSPDNVIAQQALKEGLQKQLLPKSTAYIDTVSKTMPALPLPTLQNNINQNLLSTKIALDQLAKTAKSIDDVQGNILIAKSLVDLDLAKADLETAQCFAGQGKLLQAHNITAPVAVQKLNNSIARLKTINEELSDASMKGKKILVPQKVVELSDAFDKTAAAAILVARTNPDRMVQDRVLQGSLTVLADTRNIIAASRVLVDDRHSKPQQQTLLGAKKQLNQDADMLAILATGFNSAFLDQSQDMLSKVVAALDKQTVTGDYDLIYKSALARLRPAIRAVQLPVANLVADASSNPGQIGYDAKLVTAVVTNVIGLVHLLGQSADPAKRAEILQAARTSADQMGVLLSCAKDVAANVPGAPEKTEQAGNKLLATMARIQQLVPELASSGVDDSLQNILFLLSNDNEGNEGHRLTRQDALAQLNQGSAALNKLVSQPANQNTHNELTSVLEGLVVAAQACQPSDKPIVSLAALRALEGTSLIAANQHPQQSPQIISTIVSDLAPQLLQEAKLRILKESDPQARTQMISAVQNLQKTLEACNKAKNDPAQLKANASQLRQAIIYLEGVLYDPVRASDVIVPSKLGVQVLVAVRSLAIPSTTYLRATNAITSSTPANDPLRTQATTSADEIKKSLAKLNQVCIKLDPGNEEATKALQIMQKASADLDTSLLFASIGLLDQSGAEKTKIQETQLAAKDVCKQTSLDIKQLVGAAKSGSSVELANAAIAFQHSVPMFVDQISLVAASMDDNANAQQVLTHSKNFADSLHAMTNNSLSFNQDDATTMRPFAASIQQTTQHLGTLLGFLNSGVATQSLLQQTIDAIQANLDQIHKEIPGKNQAQCEHAIATAARQVGADISSLLTAATDEKITDATNRLAQSVPALIQTTRALLGATQDASVKDQILSNSTLIAESIILALQKVQGILIGSGEKPQLLRAFNSTNKGITGLLQASGQGSGQSARATDHAMDALLDSLGSLHAQKLSIQSGTLEPSPHDPRSLKEVADNFSKSLNELPKLASAFESTNANDKALAAKNLSSALNNLVTNSKPLIAKYQKDEDKLKLLDVLIATTMSGTALMNASKQTTVNPTLIATHIAQLKQNANEAQVIVKAASEQNANLGKEMTVFINQLSTLNQGHHTPKNGATPPDLKIAAKNLLAAAGELQNAQTDQQVLRITSIFPTLLTNLHAVSLGVPQTANAPQPTIVEFQDSSKAVGDALVNFLKQNTHIQSRDPSFGAQNEAHMLQTRNQLNNTVSVLVANIKKLPQEKKAQEVSVDIDDIEAYAENELLKCANMIKEAANLLMKAAPPKKSISVGIDTADINEAILEAARGIASATGYLIECAAVSQAERKESAKSGSSKYNADPLWADGLISAAHNVAAQVKALVEAANNSASGKGPDEERLVACARAVATTTIQMVTASRVKADPGATSQRNLTKASITVTNATQQLVVAAKAASELMEVEVPEDFSALGVSAAAGIRAQMEQRSKIDKLEKELRETRQDLLELRRARYQKEDSVTPRTSRTTGSTTATPRKVTKK